mmetsp:Transcript_77170/g.233938  ORF Transcript_77170/g.233938 Transcript_77170/m.233938 type:complete len:272 (-) Transcript_77170:63-878(-)
MLVGVRLEGIEDIGVHEEVIDGKVRVPRSRLPVQRGRQPPALPPGVLEPGVRDGLVPAVGHHEAAEVVVAEDAEPLLAVEPGAGVDVLEDALPLARSIGAPVEGRAALDLNASPVEVVAHVEDVLWLAYRRPLDHLLGDILLRHVVSANNKLPVMGRKHLGAVVRRLRRHAGVGGDAAPVADEEDVVRAGPHEAHGVQRDAVEVGGHRGRGRHLEARPAGQGAGRGPRRHLQRLVGLAVLLVLVVAEGAWNEDRGQRGRRGRRRGGVVVVA